MRRTLKSHTIPVPRATARLIGFLLALVLALPAIASKPADTPATPTPAKPETTKPATPTAAKPETTATTPSLPINQTVLQPGDTIRINMVEDATITFEGTISITGTIPLPYIHDFHIAGMTAKQAEKKLSEALCEDLYQSATISIALVQKAPGKVYVYGAIQQPGVVELPAQGEMSVMQLVSEMGGLTTWAAPHKAYILRQPDPRKPAEKIPVDLTRVFQGNAAQIFVPLRNGDIFFVPGMAGNTQQVMTSDDCEIVIVGEVNAPGIVRFAPGEQRTLMRAIFKAAGFSKFAKSKAVRLIRYGGDGTRTEQIVNANDIIEEGYLDRDVELRPGDMIIVPQKLLNF